MELTWRIDRDGSLGIRQYVESKKNPGTRLSVDEYYEWIFENSVPGLPEKAAPEDLTPLGFMRRYGAFEIKAKVGAIYEETVATRGARRHREDEYGRVFTRTAKPASPNVVPFPVLMAMRPAGAWLALRVGGEIKRGFPTPSGRLEFYSRTMADWGWHEFAIPTYIKSHVHPDNLDDRPNDSDFDFPLAGADSHAQRQRQVARRNRAHKSALDSSEPCRKPRRAHRRSAARRN